MDDDLECAQAAAGCLANYVSFATRQDKDALTAGWTLVFLQRLKQCLLHLREAANPNATRKQWLALTVQCQHALWALVELNPDALDRVSCDQPTTVDFLSTMLELLHMGQQYLDSTSTVCDNERKYVQDVTMYTARTLHSALDDDVDLLRAWLDVNSQEMASDGWTMLHACCTVSTLPLVTRLHAAGCLVTARQLAIFDNNTDWIHIFHPQVIHTVLPLLRDHVEIPLNYNDLVENYTSTCSLSTTRRG